MTAPLPDIPALRKVVAWVEEEATKPDDVREWEQGAWITSPALDVTRHAVKPHRVDVPFGCGTKACVCGRLALESGAVIESGAGVLTFDGLEPPDWGAQRLGIGLGDAEDLFYYENTVEQVRAAAEAIAARVGEVL